MSDMFTVATLQTKNPHKLPKNLNFSGVFRFWAILSRKIPEVHTSGIFRVPFTFLCISLLCGTQFGWTVMLRRFCNPSCTTYRGTGSVIDIMICDHGVYHDTWSYFVILWPLLQPKVARKVAKRDGFCNLLQLTCDEKETFGTYHMVTYGHEEERSSLRAWGE